MADAARARGRAGRRAAGLGGAVFQGCPGIRWPSPICWLGRRRGARRGGAARPPGLAAIRHAAGAGLAGAWGATVAVLAVARVAGTVDAAGLLLAGVAIAAMLGALRSFLMLALSDETMNLQVVVSWVLGGIQTPTWPGLLVLALLTALCLGLTLFLARGLDTLGLGETMA